VARAFSFREGKTAFRPGYAGCQRGIGKTKAVQVIETIIFKKKEGDTGKGEKPL
jgi:hypothetical protein